MGTYAYTVHPYLKRHTGRCMSFGYGMVHFKSSKKKLNTKNPNKSKLVGVGHTIQHLDLFIYGSTIRTFCSSIIRVQNIWIKMGRSRALGNPGILIYITSFLRTGLKPTKYQLRTVAHNTCLQIILTQSLQGSLFAKFSDVIKGWKHVDTLHMVPPSTKECV